MTLSVWIFVLAAKSLLVSSLGILVYLLLNKYSASTRFLPLSITVFGLLLVSVLAFFPPLINVPVPLSFSTEITDGESSGVPGNRSRASIRNRHGELPETGFDHSKRDTQSKRIVGSTIPSATGTDEKEILKDENKTSGSVLPDTVDQSKHDRISPRFWWDFFASRQFAIGMMLVWCAGAAITLVQPLAGLSAVFCTGLRTKREREGEWPILVEQLRRELGIKRKVHVQKSKSVPSAMTWGFIRPTILLPMHADNWSADEKKYVLLHELAHIGRHDWAIQMVSVVCRALHCLNPLVWWICRRMHIEREQACDDQVILRGIEPIQYADVLLKLASEAHQFKSFAAIPMAQSSVLEQRMKSILNKNKSRGLFSRQSFAVAICGCLLGLVPISFTGAASSLTVRQPPMTTSDPSRPIPVTTSISEKPKKDDDKASETETIIILNGKDGTPIADAKINFDTDIDPSSPFWDYPLKNIAKSNKRGEVKLPKDSVDYLMFRVSHSKFLRGEFKSTGFTIPGHTLYKSSWPYGIVKGQKVVGLWPGENISGSLKDESGKPVPNFTFDIVSRETDFGWYTSIVDQRAREALGPADNRPPVEWRSKAQTDDLGRFSIAVPPKSCRKDIVAIGISDEFAPFEKVIRDDNGQMQLERGCIVYGVYRNKDGDPIPNAHVTLYQLRSDGTSRGPETSRLTITDEKGQFKFLPAASGQHLLIPHRGEPQKINLQPGKKMKFDAVAAEFLNVTFDFANSLRSFSGNFNFWIKGDVLPKGAMVPIQRVATTYIDGDKIVFRVPAAMKNAKLHLMSYPKKTVFVTDDQGDIHLPSVDTKPIEIPDLLNPPQLRIHMCIAVPLHVKVVEADGKLAKHIEVVGVATSDKGNRKLRRFHRSGKSWVQNGLMANEVVEVTVRRGDWTFPAKTSKPIEIGGPETKNELLVRLPAMKVRTSEFKEGVFFGYTGNMTYVIELKKGKFRFWFESDAKSRNANQYPLDGKYTVNGDTVTLDHRKLISLSAVWKLRSVNGIPTLWRRDAIEQHQKKPLDLSVENLRAWGSGCILVQTSESAESVWKNRTAPKQ